MQRVLIIGPCGSGKSTLARELAVRLNLPLTHMDQLNWRPGWVESSKDEIRARLDEVFKEDRWIIDGNYSGTLAERIARADTIIQLDFPISLCLWRVMRRVWTYRGRTRPDMTDDCPERFSGEFMLYLAQWKLGPGPRTEALLRGQEEKLIRLKGPRQLKTWLDSL